jgi:hypothetical protein
MVVVVDGLIVVVYLTSCYCWRGRGCWCYWGGRFMYWMETVMVNEGHYVTKG